MVGNVEGCCGKFYLEEEYGLVLIGFVLELVVVLVVEEVVEDVVDYVDLFGFLSNFGFVEVEFGDVLELVEGGCVEDEV